MDFISKELVVKEEHSARYANSHGVTAEIPSYGGLKDPAYQNLKYAKETKWDEAVNKFSA
jgi:hypothetical protein